MSTFHGTEQASHSEIPDLHEGSDTRSLTEQLDALREQAGNAGESPISPTNEPISAVLFRSDQVALESCVPSKNTNSHPAGSRVTKTGASSPITYEDFLQQLELLSPPSKSPGSSPPESIKEKDSRDAGPTATEIRHDYIRAASCPVRQETERSLDSIAGGGPRSLPRSSLSSHDSYLWNAAGCDLPNPLEIFEGTKIIPPLEERFDVTDDRFDEGVHWGIISPLGEGAFGQCSVASERKEHSKTPALFCVKVCDYQRDEVLSLTLARKNNIAEIVEFYGATVTRKENAGNATCNIFMAYMEGDSVANLVNCTREKFPDQRPVIPKYYALSLYLMDVLKALKFTHKIGLVHNDVKGANVLLDGQALHAKLADFGSATSWRDSKPQYDIWAAGCFLMEMIEGRRPTKLVAMTKTSELHSGEFPSCTADREQEILRMCFSRKCTAEEIIRFLTKKQN